MDITQDSFFLKGSYICVFGSFVVIKAKLGIYNIPVAIPLFKVCK